MSADRSRIVVSFDGFRGANFFSSVNFVSPFSLWEGVDNRSLRVQQLGGYKFVSPTPGGG